MSERLNTCPECGSTNVTGVVDTETATNNGDLNVNARLTCHDCNHQWDGQVSNPANDDCLPGWGPF